MCCRVYAIPELNKRAGDWCTHCAIGKGCKIYDQRPKMCADFACMWLQSQWQEPALRMPDEMRPDRCKVVFGATTLEGLFAAMTMPGMPDAWRKGAARTIIDRLVGAGRRVVAGPPNSTTKTMIDQRGERPVEMTEPDATGMQWSKP